MSTAYGLRWEVGMTDEERRTEIMRSLRGILKERHLSSLTLQDVADRLGMTKGNLYNYFSSKQELLYECHMRTMQESLDLLHEAKNASPTSVGQLRALMTMLAERVIEDPYGSVLVIDLENLSENKRRKYLTLRDRFEGGLRQILRTGMNNGEFAQLDVKLTSLALLGSFQWISRWYRPEGPNSPKEIGVHFANLFLNALRPIRSSE